MKERHALIITTAFVGLSSENRVPGGLFSVTGLSLAELYLLFMLGKVIWVIVGDDKENVEIEFPFRDGAYLITDGGNSKISRLMNYHFHSPVHKRKKTNRSMLYATDIARTGSITVKPGDTVTVSDKLGESGNSGMSERPHLHMQLIKCDGDDYWKGEGINMQFRGKNLYKNRLIRN
jgi:hypothetical protein